MLTWTLAVGKQRFATRWFVRLAGSIKMTLPRWSVLMKIAQRKIITHAAPRKPFAVLSLAPVGALQKLRLNLCIA